MVVQQSGFLYVYTSNESPQDVFFDNVTVALANGPFLEETHYYPFGLTMAGISSNALKGTNYPENRIKYNGNELQTKEFSDESGLEWYDFNARLYDQQIGRFQQIDPWIEFGSQEILTPYQFSLNNPIRYNDPDGKCPICPVIPYIIEGAEIAWSAGRSAKAVQTVLNVMSELAGKGGDVRTPMQMVNPAPADNTVVAKDIPKDELEKGPETIVLPAPPADGSADAPTSNNTDVSNNTTEGTRRQHRLSDKGEPNSTQTNAPGTTTKKYGPDGNTQKEYNKGHPGKNVPKNERRDHVHDYKPDPRNPSGRGKRQPGRPPKKNEAKKDFGL
ncbi:RHS repeat domain-containing protein [Chitinophaga defluvii]|uniref:RHS repeat-associated core domain-containing protein n=1 Tax=Chitinophaga defluvii TaxID=3163343 RepID=A0ABV2TEW0_9BACT